MTRVNVSRWVCLIALLLGVSLKAQAQTWSITGSMGTPRAFFTATVLSNGEVLVAGGRETGGFTAFRVPSCITPQREPSALRVI